MQFDNHVLEIFFKIHSELPREGPGSEASTLQALGLIDTLPSSPRVLDIGCGPGMQTLHLANALPGASITAVDGHKPFLDVARRSASDAKVGDRVRFETGDMFNLNYPAASFDLIWCEGAAYNMGIPAALSAWKPLLKPGGAIALTECVFLGDNTPQIILDWWLGNYPPMQQIPQCLEWFSDCGYTVLGNFTLPESDWWDDYYLPMQNRLDLLSRQYSDDKTATGVLASCQLEIDYYNQYAAHYGYEFVIARLAGR